MKPLALDKKGVTLLELMVAIAMITIMAGLATPEFTRWIAKHRLAADARNILGTLRVARSHAIATGNPVVVTFSTGRGGGGSYLAFPDLNANGTQDSGEPTVASGHVSSGTELSSATFDTNGTGNLSAPQTFFDGRGLATGRNGMVTLKNAHNRTAIITLGPAGTTSISTGR